VKVHLHVPIPPPRLWVASLDAESPPGHMRVLSASITPTPRETAKIPGTSLVPAKDIEAMQSLLQRLLQAFERCDASSRLEIITIAERLTGIT
jgi:hypothetical protein